MPICLWDFCHVFLFAFSQNFSQIEINKILSLYLIETWTLLYVECPQVFNTHSGTTHGQFDAYPFHLLVRYAVQVHLYPVLCAQSLYKKGQWSMSEKGKVKPREITQKLRAYLCLHRTHVQFSIPQFITILNSRSRYQIASSGL